MDEEAKMKTCIICEKKIGEESEDTFNGECTDCTIKKWVGIAGECHVL